MVNYQRMATVALIATFFALGVIGLGAYTRLMDAGLGCPDWPLCYGHWIPSSATLVSTHYVAAKAWAEMIHRYFAGTLSLLIITIILMSFKKILRTRNNLILSGILIILVGYQIMLGQWTVTMKLMPLIVTQHLLGGYLILSTLWMVYLTNRRDWEIHPSSALRAPSPTRGEGTASRECVEAIIQKEEKGLLVKYSLNRMHTILLLGLIPAFILLFLQIFLGAWTSTHYASLSCSEFPFCDGANIIMNFKEAFTLWTPADINYDGGVLTLSVRKTIQAMHRLGAMALTIYLILYGMIALHFLKHSFVLVKRLYIVMGLLCLQLCLGIANVIFKLPLINAIAHTITAALLLLALISFCYALIIERERL